MDSAARTYTALERALRAGDLLTARAALGDPVEFPNVRDPYTHTHVLALALSWAPLPAIRQLLDDGASPDFDAADGFPALVAVVLSDRDDSSALLALLLEAGADVERRGLNDWTPLHAAASRDDAAAIELLLGWGADLSARTSIDDHATPLEEARRLGMARAAAVLEAATPRRG